MTVSATALGSFLRPATAAAAALLLLLLIGWQTPADAKPVNKSMSGPLSNTDTYLSIKNISMEAQKAQKHDDTDLRLNTIPIVQMEKDDFQICCLHANILDFYLHNVLRHRDDKQRHMQRLKTDLHVVSENLKAHGCNVTRYHNHHHAVEFRKKLDKLPGEKGVLKALGEIDILFSYLQDSCVLPVKPTAAAAAQ